MFSKLIRIIYCRKLQVPDSQLESLDSSFLILFIHENNFFNCFETISSFRFICYCAGTTASSTYNNTVETSILRFWQSDCNANLNPIFGVQSWHRYHIIFTQSKIRTILQSKIQSILQTLIPVFF